MLRVPLNMGISATHCQENVGISECLESGHPVKEASHVLSQSVFVCFVSLQDYSKRLEFADFDDLFVSARPMWPK